jgi:hypothetical protein
MAEIAGEYLEYLAFHHMFDPDDHERPVLRNLEYRRDPHRTWDQLMQAYKIHEAKINSVRESVQGLNIPLAMTECHFAIPGRNRCEVLSSWAAGVAYARMLNVHQRHGDVLKIATAADFCGTRWQVNAVMIPVPPFRGRAFMMPVARVMSLYRHHTGTRSVTVSQVPEGLDVVASLNGDRVYIHVVNTLHSEAISVQFTVSGREIARGTVFEIATSPENEITQFNPDDIAPVKKLLAAENAWTIPAASVSAVELELTST